MSLEQALAENTAAMKELTAALKTGGTSTAKAGKSDAKSYTPKHTKEEMQAMLTSLKEASDPATAKAIIKEVGGKDKMAEIDDPATIDKVYDAAEAKLAEVKKKKDDDGM